MMDEPNFEGQSSDPKGVTQPAGNSNDLNKVCLTKYKDVIPVDFALNDTLTSQMKNKKILTHHKK